MPMDIAVQEVLQRKQHRASRVPAALDVLPQVPLKLPVTSRESRSSRRPGCCFASVAYDSHGVAV